MTIDTMDSVPLTYEGIADNIVKFLRYAGALREETSTTPWDAFLRLSETIHCSYQIPSTTFTPMMRRLVFALGVAARPSTLIGIGTFVGYTFSWLIRNRSDRATVHCERALGVDVNARANAIARKNCSVLGHGDRLTYMDADGCTALKELSASIDLLYLDLDDPHSGKSGYRTVLNSAVQHLRPGAIVLAHDACVRRFKKDFDQYHNYVRKSGLFWGPWIFPVDDCGLSVTVMR
jgi:predicted O-methyltransferase YrrM